MRDPVSHFLQLSNEETWKVLSFSTDFKSTFNLHCCRSWFVVCPTSSWRRATGSSRSTTTTGTNTMWFLCLKTLRWLLNAFHLKSSGRLFSGVFRGMHEVVPWAFFHASPSTPYESLTHSHSSFSDSDTISIYQLLEELLEGCVYLHIYPHIYLHI